MDFNFVNESLARRTTTQQNEKPHGASHDGQPAPAGSTNHFKIPSYREVQAQEKKGSVTNTFHASGRGNVQPPQTIPIAMASLHTGQPTASSSWMPAPHQQQQQQQQQQNQVPHVVHAPQWSGHPAASGGPTGSASGFESGMRPTSSGAAATATAFQASSLRAGNTPSADWGGQNQQQGQQQQQQQQYHHNHNHQQQQQSWSGGRGPGVNLAAASSSAQANPNAIVVAKRQAGNPLLKHIRNVRWQHGDVTADYVLGQNTCALFISLRYHLLHPEYIQHRIKEQLRAWGLIILLCHIDVDDVVKPLAEVTKAAVLNACTLVCAWSPEECARYLETFKSYESKPASSIQERVDHDYASRLASALTGAVRGVNKTDAATLGATRGTFADILRSTPEQLSACPGIGPTKVQRLLDAFNQPFRKEVVKTNTTGATADEIKTFTTALMLDPVITEEGGLQDDASIAEEDDSMLEDDELLLHATQMLAKAAEGSDEESASSDCDNS